MQERRTSKFILRLVENADYLAQKAGEDVAFRFYAAVDETCEIIMRQPSMGLLLRYPDPELANLRLHPVEPPFNKWLIIYHFEAETVTFWTVEHGAQDLPKKLSE